MANEAKSPTPNVGTEEPEPPQSVYLTIKQNDSTEIFLCRICQTQFQSYPAICGHMSAHKERGWRGMTIPPQKVDKFVGENVQPVGKEEQVKKRLDLDLNKPPPPDEE